MSIFNLKTVVFFTIHTCSF